MKQNYQPRKNPSTDSPPRHPTWPNQTLVSPISAPQWLIGIIFSAVLKHCVFKSEKVVRNSGAVSLTMLRAATASCAGRKKLAAVCAPSPSRFSLERVKRPLSSAEDESPTARTHAALQISHGQRLQAGKSNSHELERRIEPDLPAATCRRLCQ